MYIFSHSFYCCYKPLPLCWALQFCGVFLFSPFLLSSSIFFSFLFFMILSFNFLKTVIFFLPLFLCLPFLLCFPPCSYSLMYVNPLHLPLFNFAYLFFLVFLSFPLNIFVSFIFIALFPTWHLALVSFSSLCLSFILVDIIFGFLCLPGQFIVLYFCWTVLILLMGVYIYVCICVY